MATYLRFLECAAADVPTSPAGTVSFFLNSADGTPSFKDETGVVTPITSADPELAAIAGLTSAANKGIIFTGSGTAAVFDLSAAALTVLDDGTVAAMVDTLGGAASTGTGGLVRATGPTLSSPVVGTQTAGDNSTKAASTAYVDAAVAAALAGLAWKQAVRVATTAALTLASDFENGDTVDGVVLATGDRILVKNQASATENGIYVVAASGAPTRATDADSGAELVGAAVFVSEGTANGDTAWTCTTNATITIGATNIVFAAFGTGGTPGAHATSHQSGGSDPIKLDDFAAPDDNTDLDASTSAHGLLKKLPGGTTTFLRSDGAFAAVGGSAGGGVVLLESHTASASASLDFTTAISGSYDTYMVQGINVIPATDATNMTMQFSTDGGSTWINSGYKWAYEYLNGSGTSGVVFSASDSTMHIANANKNVRGLSFSLKLHGPGLATVCRVENFTIQQNSGDSNEYVYRGFAVDFTTSARNALRFFFSSGNIASGTIRVYGIAQ